MANTVATLNTAFRYVWEKKLNDLKPNSTIIYDLAGALKEQDKLGRKFLWPVVLSFPMGYTFGDGTAYTYEDDVEGIYDEIELDSNPVSLKERISVAAADRAAKTKDSAISMMSLRGGQMKQSLLKMAEIQMMLGRSAVGIGVVGALSAVDTGPTPDQLTITFTDATWAPGLWSGLKGARLEARATNGTKRNANEALILHSVLHATKQIIVAGDNTDLTAVAATDAIFFLGSYANSQFGLHHQMSFSGSVFGIDNSVYDLWKANLHPVGGKISMAKLLSGAQNAVTIGGLDEDCVFVCSPKSWQHLNDDLSAQRTADQAKGNGVKRGTNGYRYIEYHAQFGCVEIVSHPFCMEGYGYLFPKSSLRKIGTTDVTFKSHAQKGEYIIELEQVAGYQMVGRYDFQVLQPMPAKTVLYTGITV